ncbi:MAG TPA: hypothetical protein PKX08_19425 [Cyclobacteriaceae bacterium]|nr:hypothetical protein [Cyclobacteriaceae bacterium]
MGTPLFWHKAKRPMDPTKAFVEAITANSPPTASTVGWVRVWIVQ